MIAVSRLVEGKMAVKQRLVVFKIGDEEFAADIMLVKRVEIVGDITPIPETHNYVEGVINLRGNLIPVIDFRKRLRASGRGGADDRRIIIVNLDGKLTGLIVDDASEVVRVEEGMVEAPPDIVSEMGVDYVAGVVNVKGRFITMVDLRKALTDEITCELDEVMKRLLGGVGKGSQCAASDERIESVGVLG